MSVYKEDRVTVVKRPEVEDLTKIRRFVHFVPVSV